VTRGGVDHISGAVAGMPVAIDWVSRRLAGGRARRPQPPSDEIVVDARAA
jgi:hypothetical protein